MNFSKRIMNTAKVGLGTKARADRVASFCFSFVSVSRRAALCRLASRRRVAAGRRGRRVSAHPGVTRMRPSRLGGTCRRRPGGSASGSGRVPEPEQEGRSRPQIRAIRATAVRRERDATDRRRRPRQRLPDRSAAAQEAVLTENRDARQALQTVLPDRQDPRGRGKCVRVEARVWAGKRTDNAGSELRTRILRSEHRSAR